MVDRYNVFGIDANTTVLRDKPFLETFKKEAKIILNPAINGQVL